jgi:hypothetical protein
MVSFEIYKTNLLAFVTDEVHVVPKSPAYLIDEIDNR